MKINVLNASIGILRCTEVISDIIIFSFTISLFTSVITVDKTAFDPIMVLNENMLSLSGKAAIVVAI
jgi:hypothetical protein